MLKSTLEQWRMLKAVIDHGGFSQAADAVHKSQSTVHHAVHKLEEQLNVKLLRVDGRKAVLTEAGELMLRRASYVLQEASKLEAIAGSLSRGVETKLKIAVDGAFPQSVVFNVLETVSLNYPFLRIEVFETVLSGANELVEMGKVDIAITGIPATSGLNEEICQVRFIAVAHPDHELHQLQRDLSFEDLKSHRQIVVRDSALNANIDSGWLGAEKRWTVSNLATSAALVSKGFGFAWLPETEISEHLQQGRLKPLQMQTCVTRNVRFMLNCQDADRLGPAARAFMSELRVQTQHMPVLTDDDHHLMQGVC